MTEKVGDYEVGYQKPPKDTRFQKGQSGNPRGRPKGAKNLRTVVLEAYLQPVASRDRNGRVRKIPSISAALMNLRAMALGSRKDGNPIDKQQLEAIKTFVDVGRNLGVFDDKAVERAEPEHRDILEAFLKRKRSVPDGGDHA